MPIQGAWKEVPRFDCLGDGPTDAVNRFDGERSPLRLDPRSAFRSGGFSAQYDPIPVVATITAISRTPTIRGERRAVDRNDAERGRSLEPDPLA